MYWSWMYILHYRSIIEDVGFFMKFSRFWNIFKTVLILCNPLFPQHSYQFFRIFAYILQFFFCMFWNWLNKRSVFVYREIPNLQSFCIRFAVVPLTPTNHSRIKFLHVLKLTEFLNKRLVFVYREDLLLEWWSSILEMRHLLKV